ncbi:MAG: nicotinate phosphoribosyltransferase [Chitinophagaceae bacterium]|nr:nicotinate phosphoribosyltransferase [Chitinophagaceae bacterium]
MKIESILDNDFYKFTMQNAVVNLYPKARAKYAFINRGNHKFPPGFGELLKAEIKKFEDLKLTVEEKKFLSRNCPYLTPTFLDFLQGFRYDADEVTVKQEGGELSVEIEGYWYRTILWEVPIMYLICELYYRQPEVIAQFGKRTSDEEVAQTAKTKIEKYKSLGITIADFGTRRRHSYEVQKIVVDSMRKNGTGCFTGTSNVHLAMLLGTKPIGTHAHEWFMFHAAKYGFKMSNPLALENWVQVYRGDLGIALSDTYTSEVFFRAFDKKFSKLFDGVRHDSGDPIQFATKVIEHYKSLGIDPVSKTIIFSDSLDYDKVKKIAGFCKGKIKASFGIGTNFTNDVGLPPLNIVVKMTEARPDHGEWNHVVKLSDDKGKYTGDPATIELAKIILHI